MVWVSIIKVLGIASLKSIYPKILTSYSVRGIRLINKSYFSVINKTTVTTCLEVSKDCPLPKNVSKNAIINRSTVCNSSRFPCQQRVLKMFPGPSYLTPRMR